MSVVRLARLVVLALVLGGCAPTWKAADHPARASLYEHPWIWLDDSGTRVTFSQLRGKPLVLAAIYTTCEETCPRTLGDLHRLYDQFSREHRQAEFVVVTIDPETDTPERLRAYRQAKALPAAWRLWTGGSEETQQLADVLGIHVMDMESHTVHDSKIVLFNGNGVYSSELDIL